MEFEHDFETTRYSGHIAKNTDIVVEGLNTETVVLNGDWSGERTAETASDRRWPHTTDFSHTLSLTDITYTYDSSSGDYFLTSGSGSSSIEGLINDKTFIRQIEWTFNESYTEIMSYQGEVLTVNIVTGEIIVD